MAPKVLFVVTSHSSYVKKDDKGNVVEAAAGTGWYLPELAHPYNILKAKGVEIDVVSPAGGRAPLDGGSHKASQKAWDLESLQFVEAQSTRTKEDGVEETVYHPNYPILSKAWQETKVLKDYLGKSSEYAAVFYPGGHGPMFDLHTDENSIKLIQEFYNAGKPVSAVCHGPIVFAEVKIGDKYLVDGRKVTGFTDGEEGVVGLIPSMPVLLETRLKERGAVFEQASAWQPKTVVDGQIITGQNPASAAGVGEALAKAIGV